MQILFILFVFGISDLCYSLRLQLCAVMLVNKKHESLILSWLKTFHTDAACSFFFISYMYGAFCNKLLWEHEASLTSLSLSLSDRFGLIHQARISASVNAMRILNTGTEVEAAVADALVRIASLHQRLISFCHHIPDVFVFTFPLRLSGTSSAFRRLQE